MTIEHAKRELELAGLFDKDSDYDGALGTAVMELVEVFSKQGHSGFSAGRVISLFKEVALHNCLTPLSGETDEWNEIGDNILQNNRVSSVFKDLNTGKSYFLDAITWRTQTESTWSGTAETKDGERITDRQYIKSFPFTPKRFTIDVIEEEVSKDNWKFVVKDEKDLEKVFEIYDKYNPEV